MRRAIGITSYYNRVTPTYKPSRPRPVKREDKPLYVVKELPMAVDVTSPEVKRQEKEDAIFGAKSLFGQALLCLTAILLVLNIINQVIKLCF